MSLEISENNENSKKNSRKKVHLEISRFFVISRKNSKIFEISRK